MEATTASGRGEAAAVGGQRGAVVENAVKPRHEAKRVGLGISIFFLREGGDF